MLLNVIVINVSIIPFLLLLGLTVLLFMEPFSYPFLFDLNWSNWNELTSLSRLIMSEIFCVCCRVFKTDDRGLSKLCQTGANIWMVVSTVVCTMLVWTDLSETKTEFSLPYLLSGKRWFTAIWLYHWTKQTLITLLPIGSVGKYLK